MARFYLYRVILLQHRQLPLFDRRVRQEVLYAALHEKPAISTRGRVAWHIGNVEDLDERTLYFRIGKTGPLVEARFDESTADFIDTESESAPYTHAFFDLRYQVCAIATNTRLAPSATSIARRLANLLNSTDSTRGSSFMVSVKEIQNPEPFIEALKHAYAVYRFSVGFGLPNPIDPEHDFEQPMQTLLQKLGGSRGAATVNAEEDLDRDAIAELTRAAASRGNPVSARLKVSGRANPETRKLHGSPASVGVDDIPQTHSSRREFAKKVIAAYLAVRRGDDGDQDNA